MMLLSRQTRASVSLTHNHKQRRISRLSLQVLAGPVPCIGSASSFWTSSMSGSVDSSSMLSSIMSISPCTMPVKPAGRRAASSLPGQSPDGENNFFTGLDCPHNALSLRAYAAVKSSDHRYTVCGTPRMLLLSTSCRGMTYRSQEPTLAISLNTPFSHLA